MSAKTSSQAKKQENKALFTCFGDVNGECQKLLQIRTRILWAILLIVNIISTTAYLVVTLSMKMEIDLIIMICFAVILIASIAMFVVLHDQIKKANNLGVINQYDFYEKTIKAKSIKDGQVKGTANHFYSEFILVKKVKDFIFLSPTKSSYYPINVKNMSEEEYKTLLTFIDKMTKAKKKNI